MSGHPNRVRAMIVSFGMIRERHRGGLGRATASLPYGDPRGLPTRLSPSRRRGRYRECHAAGLQWAPPAPGERPYRELCPMIVGRAASRGSPARLPRSRVRGVHLRAGGGAVPALETGRCRRLLRPCTPVLLSPPFAPRGMTSVAPQVRALRPGSCASCDGAALQIDEM